MNVFLGYQAKADENSIWSVDDQGARWLNTGDLGYFDAEGFLHLNGRSKDLIIRGGHNIDPKAVEDVLCQHSSVALAAVIGKPDFRLGEIPAAFVMLRDGHTATVDELFFHIRLHVEDPSARPVQIKLLSKMPVTAVGKIYKPALRRELIEDVLNTALLEHSVEVAVSIVNDHSDSEELYEFEADITSKTKIEQARSIQKMLCLNNVRIV
jgi:fatty-acyl-CoA synthase